MQQKWKEVNLFLAVALAFLISSHCSVQTACADLDAAKAAFNLGDYSLAFKEFGRIAKEGNPVAQYYLGVIYAKGEGVPQNYAEAAKWFRKAADQGYASAQGELGLMYAKGRGVPQDYLEAVQWFGKAADQNLAEAQSGLGFMYEQGQGIPQDYVQAYMWFNLAGAQGHPNAVEHRDIVAKKMTPEQLAEGQRLSKAWKLKKEQ
jgi:hypothetical protein